MTLKPITSGKTLENGTTHSKRGAGLRNRWRKGRYSTYSIKRKKRYADRYGKFVNGRADTQDVIAGHVMWAVVAEKS